MPRPSNAIDRPSSPSGARGGGIRPIFAVIVMATVSALGGCDECSAGSTSCEYTPGPGICGPVTACACPTLCPGFCPGIGNTYPPVRCPGFCANDASTLATPCPGLCPNDAGTVA